MITKFKLQNISKKLNPTIYLSELNRLKELVESNRQFTRSEVQLFEGAINYYEAIFLDPKFDTHSVVKDNLRSMGEMKSTIDKLMVIAPSETLEVFKTNMNFAFDETIRRKSIREIRQSQSDN